jgi:sec-independent protein translocase protein TatC
MKININSYYKYYLEIKHRFFLVTLSWIFTTGICYLYKDSLLFLLINSTNTLMNVNTQPYFIFTDISEIFYVYINIIFFISNQISLVLLLYHLLIFLSLGLYRIELIRFKFLFKYFVFTWLISALIFYNILIPFSWEFFLTFQQTGTVDQPISLLFEAKLFDFLDYFTKFYNLCFFSCQFLIVIIFFLNNFVNKQKQIKNFRKIFYLIFLVFSTIITPPDILSQVIITSYLILIYEIITFLHYLKFNLATN